MKRLASLLVLVLMLALVVPGCASDEGTNGGTDDGAVEGDEIIIGAALCQTGIQAPLDEPALRGAQLAVDDLNAAG
ncbi:MAG: hypothetical protein Q8M55_08115, partial [Actinomycetota bacterium]|nr:hypothetical protein [Actinomycetota bacterium]